MYHSFKKITFLLFVTISSAALGQQNTHSPYSLFGVGMRHYDGFADNIANGRNGVSYRYESNFTFTNPASLSALKNTAFNVATYIDLGQFQTSTVVQNFSNAGFNYIALGIPLKKIKGGMAFGLLPYSDVGYNNINVKDSGGIAMRNEYEGRGGLSKVNMSMGANFFKYLSLGFNYSFIFGQMDESQRKHYPGNRYMKNFADINEVFIKGHHLDFGLQLHTNSDKGMTHVFGAMLSTNSKLKGERDRTVYTYTQIFTDDEESFKDTLLHETGKATSITLPTALNLSYTFGNHEKWQATAGYSKTLWSKYKNMFGDNSGFSDDNSFSAGIFFCPKPLQDISTKATMRKTYYKSIRYSAGFHHSTGYINAYDNKIAETGISVGFGFPFTKLDKDPEKGNTVITSRIFLTGEFVKRGTINNNLIQENFFRLTLGLNLGDKWFKKNLFN